jgi:hypothetical protein
VTNFTPEHGTSRSTAEDSAGAPSSSDAAAVAADSPARRPGSCRVQRQRLAEFVTAAGQVAQHQRQPGGQPAGEAAAGGVVPGEEEVHRQHHDQREDHPGRDLEHQRAVARVAHSLPRSQVVSLTDGL